MARGDIKNPTALSEKRGFLGDRGAWLSSNASYGLRVAGYGLRVAPLLLHSKRDLRSASTG